MYVALILMRQDCSLLPSECYWTNSCNQITIVTAYISNTILQLTTLNECLNVLHME